MTTTSRERLDRLAEEATRRDLFDEVRIEGDRLACRARGSAAEAWYRLDAGGPRWRVGLVTADRWLSESIESDLMHYGDPIEELVAEELVELGVEVEGTPPRVPVRHFRSDDLLYTFETDLPEDRGGDADLALHYLLAYEAAFRVLGDMTESEEE